MIDLKALEDITNAFGPSGFEEEVLKAIYKHKGNLLVKNDAMNNAYATIEGLKGNKPVIMLDAHSDECGFMVQNIEENGLLSIIMLGGFHLTNLPAHSVIVRNKKGEKIRGIITSKPIHFLTTAQRADNNLTIEDLKVDVGASSRKEIEEEYGISVGDPITPDVSFSYDEKHKICFGKAFDNRLGCLCILETMKALEKDRKDLKVDVVGAFATQEEVGTRGAEVTSKRVDPELAIVFEGSPADDFYFGVGMAQCAMKKGTQIRHMDSGYIANPEFVKFAHEIGKKYKIKYQDAVRRGGSTNAAKISIANKAVPVLVLGIPTRYVHTHYNYCAIEDIESTVNMAVEVIKGLEEKNIKTILKQNILEAD